MDISYNERVMLHSDGKVYMLTIRHRLDAGRRGRRLALLTTLGILLSTVFVVGAEAKQQAAQAQDTRCDNEVIELAESYETTLTPVGSQIVITRAQCAGPSSSDTANEIVVTANPTGVQEFVILVARGVQYQQSGGSTNVTQLQLHVPSPPSSNLCVTINGEKHCLPPGS